MASKMKRFSTILAVTILGVATLLSGVLHGHMSHRWGPSRDSLEAAKKLAAFPDQFADWQLASSEKLERSVVEMLQCTGYISRAYVHRVTGETVRFSVILGPPGQISVHTPEICYSSQDQTIVEPRHAEPIKTSGDTQDDFWSVTFRRNDLQAEEFCVYYGWSTGRRWTASPDPRFAFAGFPYLYKLQIASPLPAAADANAKDACRRFLEDFVPVAGQYLVECARSSE